MNENLKIAVVLRTGRAAIGMNQQEFSEALGIAKSTLARAETLEMPMRAETYFRALKIFKEHGVEVDPIYSEGIDIKVSPEALDIALSKLEDETQRRTDRKKAREQKKNK
jgi:transcriptional regulator with XRE-family HTH domain